MSLRVENLSLERGARVLQQGLSFELEPSEVLRIKGLNGVGKSTLLETICGFRPIFDGEIYWQNEPIKTQEDQFHDALDYLGHKNANNPNLSARSALEFYAKLYDSSRLDQALELVGLTSRSDVGVRELSAGQQKRLSIARLLLRDSQLWILDEPSVSLDQDGLNWLVDLIRERLKIGTMIIYTSHVELGLDGKELFLEKTTHHKEVSRNEYLAEEWEGVV